MRGGTGVPRLTKSSVPALVEGHGFEGRALALGAVVVRINVIGLYAPAGVVNLLSLTSSLAGVDAGRAADARAAGSARIGLGGGGHGGGARGAGRSTSGGRGRRKLVDADCHGEVEAEEATLRGPCLQRRIGDLDLALASRSCAGASLVHVSSTPSDDTGATKLGRSGIVRSADVAACGRMRTRTVSAPGGHFHPLSGGRTVSPLVYTGIYLMLPHGPCTQDEVSPQ